MIKYINEKLAEYTRGIVNETVDTMLERMVRDQYTENLYEMAPVTKKVDPIYLMEILMRSNQGTPVSRPLGHRRLDLSPWNKVMFNPVHLFRFPTPDNVSISSSVTIGRKAKKPLELAIPIMITGMSFGGALSKNAKIALAKAASRLGTASNTGEAGLLKEEREAAGLLIGQYNRGGWLNTKDKYSQMDAVEIQLGQGAQGSTPQRTAAKNIGKEMREVFGVPEGEDLVIHSRLPGVDTREQFTQLVKQLKEDVDVPVGVKFAASHHLEKEMQAALEAGVDFITIDGAEGGTHGASPTLEDDLGLPTIFAVARAAKYLTNQGVKDDVSLIAAGGLVTPGDCLKAMALGADAVYMGTAVMMALIGDQLTKVLPFEPPTDLVVYSAKMTEKLDPERSAESLFNFLNAVVVEMQQVCYSLGKTSLSYVAKDDLVSLDPFLGWALGIELGFISPQEQAEFYTGSHIPPGQLPLNYGIPEQQETAQPH